MTVAAPPGARIVAFIIAGEGPHLIAPGLVKATSTASAADEPYGSAGTPAAPPPAPAEPATAS